MANNQNLKSFTKGDPRINLGGRPKNLDVMRQVAKDLCYEPNDLSTDSVARNRLEAILRDWITSNDFRKQQAFVQIAFGRVPSNEKRKKERNHVIIDWGDDDPQRIGAAEATRNGVSTQRSVVHTPQKRSPALKMHSLSFWLHHRKLPRRSR